MRFALMILAVLALAAPAGAQTRPSEPTAKPWVDDWIGFVNRDSKHRWVRGDAPRTALSAEEARINACADAAAKLLPTIKAQWNIIRTGRTAIRVSDAYAISHIKDSLASGTAVEDSYVKRHEKAYGDVWEGSVLVDASPATIDNIARAVAAQARADYQEKLAQENRDMIQKSATWGSLVAFLGIIVLLYWFLNAATKGYFTWRLRLGAVTLVALAAVSALLVSSFWAHREVVIIRPAIQINR